MIKMKRLEMWNFKSFKRANIPFGEGFTTIVGPNGTGKSNIIDALLFVFGITSLKMMRANKLTDLVNNGAEDGTARVDLYLDGDKAYKISRTIDRQGKSVYRMDDKRCSLNEVASLLKELGISAKGYNVVVQGDITRIIQMNPKERRGIIEDVAGIKEFDEKRDESFKELEKVEARVKEARIVLNERDQFLKDLAAEREAAKKFEQLSLELKQTKATVLRMEMDSIRRQNSALEEKEKGIAESIAEKAKKRQEAAEKISGIEQAIEEINNALIHANEELFSEIGKEIEQKKAKKSICEDKKSAFSEELQRQSLKKSGLEEKNREAERQKETIGKELAEISALQKKANELFKELERERVSENFLENTKRQSARGSELSAVLDSLKRLKKADSSCPTCDSKLGAKKVKELIAQKEALEKSLREEIGAIDSALKELGQKKSEEERTAKELQDLGQKMFFASTRKSAFEKEALESLALEEEAGKGIAELEEKIRAIEKEGLAAEKDVKELEIKYIKANEKNRHKMAEKEELRQRLSGLQEKKNSIDFEIRGKEQDLNSLNIEKTKNSVRLSDLAEEEKEFDGIQGIQGILGQLKERVPRIEREISSLGAINMKALNSFGELDNEVQELRKKANKLEEERISVMNLIQSIEDRRLQAFQNAFEEVKKNFGKLFFDFFEGEGLLNLSDEKNPLDSGLIIEARHKGEKMKSIDLMSGGEKTLTALAFLFAIQLYEPSPFYLFDEVDAALDKENSKKVAVMMKQVSGNSQFVAITHNDQMVKESDQLVGVALNKQKSSVIGLKLKERIAEVE